MEKCRKTGCDDRRRCCSRPSLGVAQRRAMQFPPEQAGIRGNGHMVMIEKNNFEIAAFIDRWLSTNVR